MPPLLHSSCSLEPTRVSLVSKFGNSGNERIFLLRKPLRSGYIEAGSLLGCIGGKPTDFRGAPNTHPLFPLRPLTPPPLSLHASGTEGLDRPSCPGFQGVTSTPPLVPVKASNPTNPHPENLQNEEKGSLIISTSVSARQRCPLFSPGPLQNPGGFIPRGGVTSPQNLEGEGYRVFLFFLFFCPQSRKTLLWASRTATLIVIPSFPPTGDVCGAKGFVAFEGRWRDLPRNSGNSGRPKSHPPLPLRSLSIPPPSAPPRPRGRGGGR